MRTRSPASSGPISPQEFYERRQQQLGRQAVAYILLSRQARTITAYSMMKFDEKVLRRVGVKPTGATVRVLYGAGRLGARVGTKMVPVVGWVSLGYDAYQFGRWVNERRK